MIEIRSILIPALTSALQTATGLKVYDGIPIHLFGTLVFPRIEISDVFVSEDGPKNSFQYTVNVLLEIQHKNIKTMETLYSDMDKVKSLINNRSPFTLASPYEIMDCVLNNSTTSKATVNSDLIDIGIIRLVFRIT
jgi:hypothetical protein